MSVEPNSATTAVSRCRVWLPAFLLVGTAITQIVLAKNFDLSPWKGGGFGMFATLDGTAFRHIRIFVESPQRSEELAIAPSQQRLADQAKLYPSEDKLIDLAKAVAGRERRYDRPVTSVRVEVWRSEFNDYLEATDRPLRSFSWNVEQPARK